MKHILYLFVILLNFLPLQFPNYQEAIEPHYDLQKADEWIAQSSIKCRPHIHCLSHENLFQRDGRHGLTTIYPITATSSRLIFAWRVSTVRQPWSLNGALRPPNSPLSLLRINFKDEDLCAPRGFLLRVEQTQFALKQGASSHNLALREIQRQREETPLFKAARPRRI